MSAKQITAKQERDLAFERGVPQNAFAESCVLWAVLTSATDLTDVAAVLEPEDFFTQDRRLIYTTCLDLRRTGTPVDLVSVSTYLKNHDKLSLVGGVSGLSDLGAQMPAIVNALHWAHLVKEASALRSILQVSLSIQEQTLLQHAKPDTVISEAVALLHKTDASLRLKDAVNSVAEIITEVGPNELLNPTKHVGVPTGYTGIDDMVRLLPGTLNIIGARPSMGKSSLASNIAMKMAHRNSPVGIFSMEMTKRNYIERMICSLAEIDYKRLLDRMLFDAEKKRSRDALNAIFDLPMYIDESVAMTHQQIASKVHRLKEDKGCQVFMIDYLQQMGSDRRGREQSPNERFTEITEALRNMAKKEGVVVIALSQLSRAPDQRRGDHRPMLSDLRDSGNIEQAADTVAFLYRHHAYDSTDPSKAKDAEFIVKKQRNGPVGTVPLIWRKEFMRFDSA